MKILTCRHIVFLKQIASNTISPFCKNVLLCISPFLLKSRFKNYRRRSCFPAHCIAKLICVAVDPRCDGVVAVNKIAASVTEGQKQPSTHRPVLVMPFIASYNLTCSDAWPIAHCCLSNAPVAAFWCCLLQYTLYKVVLV